MPRPEIVKLKVPLTAAGTPQNPNPSAPPIGVAVERFMGTAMRAQMGGTLTAGSTKLQGSIDGEHWTDLGTFTAAGQIVEITAPWKWLRMNTTADLTGAPEVHLLGLDATVNN